MAHLSGDRMAVPDQQIPRHRHAQFSVQAVADPPSPDVGHLFHAGNMGSGVRDGLERVGIDAVQHPHQHGTRRLPDKGEDCRRDEEANYRPDQDRT